jgi:hypothetical protein
LYVADGYGDQVLVVSTAGDGTVFAADYGKLRGQMWRTMQ